MTDDELAEAIEEVSGYIRRDVAGGFAELDAIVPNALEVVGDEYPADELRPHAERVLREAVAAQARAERSWPAVTDCDRFDAAFADLEAAGIVCRHNFSCCGTCAAGEIWDEIEAERNIGREIVGCAHYNCQDTESAVEGYGVYLSYGSVLKGERPAVDVGHQIARAMRARGLRVTWDGSLSKRIHVALDWKRRLSKAARPGA
jgi:hypothetical protein